jgi:uncharacterized protein (DUF433 family)
MKINPRIQMNPEIMFGKPVIKNTRITGEQILRKLAAGMTVDGIIGDHPQFQPDDIYAAYTSLARPSCRLQSMWSASHVTL